MQNLRREKRRELSRFGYLTDWEKGKCYWEIVLIPGESQILQKDKKV